MPKTASEEARELEERICQALSAFPVGRPEQYRESEVQFRYDAIQGVLLMARNDVRAMLHEWLPGDELHS